MPNESPASNPSAAGARVLILATSLHPRSKSLVLAQYTLKRLRERGVETSLIWLRELPLPLCDGTEETSGHPNVARLREEVLRATHVLWAVPIYNYDVNAAAKNVLEHLFNWGFYDEQQWEGLSCKTTGFLCAAGGSHSYMAALPFANSLMLEGRWRVVPRYVYAVHQDFANGEVANPKIQERIGTLMDELLAHDSSPLARRQESAA